MKRSNRWSETLGLVAAVTIGVGVVIILVLLTVGSIIRLWEWAF